MKQFFLMIGFLAAVFMLASRLSAASVTDFIDFSLRNVQNTVVLPGRLYVPAAAQPGSSRPLMIFLHGSGSDGTDNVSQLSQITARMMAEAKDRGSFLYVPQTVSTWSSQTVTDEVMTMVD